MPFNLQKLRQGGSSKSHRTASQHNAKSEKTNTSEIRHSSKSENGNEKAGLSVQNGNYPSTILHSPADTSESSPLVMTPQSEIDLEVSMSNTQTEYFDVLPSFQMFQSILKRDDSQFSEDLLLNPPKYDDLTNSSSLSPVNSSTGLNRDASPHPHNLPLYTLNDSMRSAEPLSGMTLSTTNNEGSLEDFSNDHFIQGDTVMDNIDKIARLDQSPLNIEIFVTKKNPMPNTKNEAATRLKEYSNGDMVSGYINITNTAEHPVTFGMFVVSLEGVVKSVERLSQEKLHGSGKAKKILTKKFLKMYDLDASYNYTCLPSSAALQYVPFSKDIYDGSYIGLPDERVLQPHTTYKKFFNFRLPTRLLDDSCMNNVLPHVIAPPSIGLDKTSFHNKASTISLNKSLGYGFINKRGTPLLMKDYCYEDLSITYSIEAKFIDKIDPSHYDDLIKQNPNKKHFRDYVISKESQYILRFVPDYFQQLPHLKRENEFLRDSYDALGLDGIHFDDFYNLATWKKLYEIFENLDREIDAILSNREYTTEQIKSKQLWNNNDGVMNCFRKDTGFPVGEWDKRYVDHKMISTTEFAKIYGKKKKKILSSLVKIGELKVFASIPSKILNYNSPKLVKKYNSAEGDENTVSMELRSISSTPLFHQKKDFDINLSKDDSWPRLESNCPNVIPISNMSRIYARPHESIADTVDVRLLYIPAEQYDTPPALSSIDVNLVFWTYRTDQPLPFKMGYDFFYARPISKNLDLTDLEVTRNNLQEIKDKTFSYLHFLHENEIIVSRPLYLFLKSMRSLGIKKDIVKDYFKRYLFPSDSNLLKASLWTPIEQMGGKAWEMSITVPLVPVNKNNVTVTPSFQSCLLGRLYCLQVQAKYKGGNSENNEFADNIIYTDVPVVVG